MDKRARNLLASKQGKGAQSQRHLAHMEESPVDERPTHLDLFSGIGGFALAAQWAGFRTIGFCEIYKYCQKVLAKNFMADTVSESMRPEDKRGMDLARDVFQNGNGIENPERLKQMRSPIFGNIFDLDGRQFRGVSLITGGFPCQPFSVAGKRRGAADDRAIWPEMFRVISEARPAWVLGENVPGIIPMELDNVLSDLEGIGYACRSFVIPACAVDARHRRDRLWIIGRDVTDASSVRLQRSEISGSNNGSRTRSDDEQPSGLYRSIEPGNGRPTTWLPEPDVGRVAHGIPSRVDRLKGLGNAIVPAVAYEILRVIYQLHVETHSVTVDRESKDANATDMAQREKGSQESVADGTETRKET